MLMWVEGCPPFAWCEEKDEGVVDDVDMLVVDDVPDDVFGTFSRKCR